MGKTIKLNPSFVMDRTASNREFRCKLCFRAVTVPASYRFKYVAGNLSTSVVVRAQCYATGSRIDDKNQFFSLNLCTGNVVARSERI